MGEYAKRKSDGERIKIGTCESMFYLRYEDRNKVQVEPHSVDPATIEDCFWRLPYPDEDHIEPGSYEVYNRGERLWKKEKDKKYAEYFSDKDTVDNPGVMQFHNESGILLNVECYHGEKLPEGSKDIKTAWNGRSWFYELAFIKNTKEGIFPVIHCRFCGHMWRYTWEEILPYLHGELKERLAKYNK